MGSRLCLVVGAAVLLIAAITPSSAQIFGRGNGLVNESAYALDRQKWRQGAELAQAALDSGELSPVNVPSAYNNLCIGLMRMGQLDRAMTACNKAVDLKPRQWSFYNNRANIYFYRADYDRALAEYYKAMTFSPGDDVLLQNIALTLKYRRDRAPTRAQSS